MLSETAVEYLLQKLSDIWVIAWQRVNYLATRLRTHIDISMDFGFGLKI